MFPHTVTIYNKHTENKVEKWQRTVLRGVFWDSSKGAITRNTGVSSVDGLMMIVPMSIPGYKKPKEWADLEGKAGAWTLQGGDIAILGDISYEVVRSSKEILGYDDVLTITTVDTRGYGGDMAHFEVTGK